MTRVVGVVIKIMILMTCLLFIFYCNRCCKFDIFMVGSFGKGPLQALTESWCFPIFKDIAFTMLAKIAV